jgi:hypothetical protein
MFDAILQAWIGAQSICSQFCWFMLWLLGTGETNVLAQEQMTQTCMLVQIHRRHFCHLAPMAKKHWQNFWTTSVDSTTRYSAQWKKNKKATESFRSPHIPISTYTTKTISPGFCDTQNQSSLWPGFPHPRNGISHHHFEWYWIQPSADMMIPENCIADSQDPW